MENGPNRRSGLEVATSKALALPEFKTLIETFAASTGFRRFQPDHSLNQRVVLHDAVRLYLAEGAIQKVEALVENAFDLFDAKLEVIDIVSNSEFATSLTNRLFEMLSSALPGPMPGNALELIDRTVLSHLTEAILKADDSSPLDIAGDKSVTVCYIPGSGAKTNYWDVATTSWMDRSDSVSVYPDRTFMDFLRMVGLNKSEWLGAVERNATSAQIARMEAFLHRRNETWKAISDWETTGSLDIEVDDLVAAVDACPYGFTPMIAFTMPAKDVLSLDFEETLSVSGGIVGLHDFTNGTGDPLRFEGTLMLPLAPGDMHLADDQPLGLIATHGFLNSSFRSSVKTSERQHGQDVAPSVIAVANPQP